MPPGGGGGGALATAVVCVPEGGGLPSGGGGLPGGGGGGSVSIPTVEVVEVVEVSATTVVTPGVNLANASRYPGQVGLYMGLVAQGSTLYFKLKLTPMISGPYVPAQKLLSLPTKPY